jgi:hypothetical protein
VYLIYKTVYFILNKIYPTKNEKWTRNRITS